MTSDIRSSIETPLPTIEAPASNSREECSQILSSFNKKEMTPEQVAKILDTIAEAFLTESKDVSLEAWRLLRKVTTMHQTSNSQAFDPIVLPNAQKILTIVKPFLQTPIQNKAQYDAARIFIPLIAHPDISDDEKYQLHKQILGLLDPIANDESYNVDFNKVAKPYIQATQCTQDEKIIPVLLEGLNIIINSAEEMCSHPRDSALHQARAIMLAGDYRRPSWKSFCEMLQFQRIWKGPDYCFKARMAATKTRLESQRALALHWIKCAQKELEESHPIEDHFYGSLPHVIRLLSEGPKPLSQQVINDAHAMVQTWTLNIERAPEIGKDILSSLFANQVFKDTRTLVIQRILDFDLQSITKDGHEKTAEHWAKSFAKITQHVFDLPTKLAALNKFLDICLQNSTNISHTIYAKIPKIVTAAVLSYNQATLEKFILILKYVSENVHDLEVLGVVCELGSKVFLTNTQFDKQNQAIADILVKVLNNKKDFCHRSSIEFSTFEYLVPQKMSRQEWNTAISQQPPL